MCSGAIRQRLLITLNTAKNLSHGQNAFASKTNERLARESS
ncbi:Unknown protein sequence [Pseudomonas syringae pv. cilantro]|uniref:Uncharacterized protein n=1 Tax=Pseudomonas syringae pv. cilantro TaxID=81035 RepID=A0A0N0X8I3_PSESX|nr:Unknown protein sequence [Pseudomonas syringae pv. cilantro]